MLIFRLSHDGSDWIAETADVRARGRTLPELDRGLARLLAEKDPAACGQELKVLMTFDGASIPQWMRQYSNHYFNRIVTIKLA